MWHFQQVKKDYCLFFKVRKISSLSLVYTAAVAVDTFRASSRLCCLTREFVMVSKWDAGTHPRCRSDSLVPSTQSEEQRNTKQCKWSQTSSKQTPCPDEMGKFVALRSMLCWCTRIISAFSRDSSSGCWATNARIHCICEKSACGGRTGRLQHWPLTIEQPKINSKENTAH